MSKKAILKPVSFLLVFLLVLNFNVSMTSNQKGKAISVESGKKAYAGTNKPHRVKELVEKRTLNSKHFLNDDGTITAEISSENMHYSIHSLLYCLLINLLAKVD